MALSKHQLVSERNQNLLWFFSNANVKTGCKKLAICFQIVETAATAILKDGKKRRKNFNFIK